MMPLHSPHGKAPHLHASQFSSSEIFYKTTSAFLKTGINVRNVPPAHSSELEPRILLKLLKNFKDFEPRYSHKLILIERRVHQG